MRTIKYYMSVAAICAALTLLFYGVIRLDFYLWRKEHPTTPTWVYWARGGK